MSYQRKTKDEYQIMQYFPAYGWEEGCSEETYREAIQRRKEYRENQPEYPVKIKKVRIPI